MLGSILLSLRVVLIFMVFFLLSFIFMFVFLIRFKNTSNNLIFGKTFSYISIKILRIKVNLRGEQILQNHKHSVIIANHQSYFDAIVFGAIIPPNTLIIGKKSLIWFPLFGWVFYLAGNLLLNRKNHKKAMGTMRNVDIALQNGSSLWIFPEGTRSHGKGLKDFKKGAFYAALQNNVPLQPIVVSTLKDSLNFKKWNPGKILVEVLEPIQTKGVSVEEITSLMTRAHEIMKNKITVLDNELSTQALGSKIASVSASS